MMRASSVADNVFRLSANADQSILFESIWPLYHGVAMNSYIVRGREIAIVDGVCGWDGVPGTLLRQFDELGILPEDVKHVVMNHLEPDHSGWIEDFKKITDDFVVHTSSKGVELAKAFYGIEEERLHAVSDGDVLDLGNGVRLRFREVPNVHWPETIVTFEEGTGTLFSGDAFGSFGSVGEHPYDEQLSSEERELFEEETLRYFANIIGAFSIFVQRALKKVGELPVRTIAPAHGIVWRKDPQRIVDLYSRYASWSQGPALPEVAVIWGSMYGMTGQALAPLLEGIRDEGVPFRVHRVPHTHVSTVLASAWRSAGIAVGMPTYEYKMFPPMAAVLDDLCRKKVLNRLAFRFGSFGWSGGAQKELDELMQRYRTGWEFLDPVEFKGRPRRDDLELMRDRGRALARGVLERVGTAGERRSITA